MPYVYHYYYLFVIYSLCKIFYEHYCKLDYLNGFKALIMYYILNIENVWLLIIIILFWMSLWFLFLKTIINSVLYVYHAVFDGSSPKQDLKHKNYPISIDNPC